MPAISFDELAAPALPLERGSRGFFRMAFGKDVIDASIADILATKPGERVMRPTYGCRIHEVLFEPLDEISLAVAKRHVSDALALWERRITVKSVEAAWDDSNDERPILIGQVTWLLRQSRSSLAQITEIQQAVGR